MPLIFWDIKERPETRKKIAQRLKNVEREVNKLISVANKDSTGKVILTDSKNIRRINKTYRKIDRETDVLSFTEDLNEIYINYDWIKKDKRSVEELFIHGYLHLMGYDHENDKGEMEKLENKLRKNILKNAG